MIEPLPSRNGETVLTYDGRYMASSVDPRREAASWLGPRENQLRHVDTAFVLGVGCGYHLLVLQKKRPDLRVVAVDTRKECIDFCRREHALDLADVYFVHATHVDNLKNNRTVCRAVKSFYTTLSFQPAQISDPIFYREIENLFCARSREGFEFVTAQRPDMQKALQIAPDLFFGDKLLSIKNLGSGAVKDENADVAQIIHLLRELVI